MLRNWKNQNKTFPSEIRNFELEINYRACQCDVCNDVFIKYVAYESKHFLVNMYSSENYHSRVNVRHSEYEIQG